jgi:acetylornithine deacetylase/succinyl-diaminopimelate desuccinylase family protein
MTTPTTGRVLARIEDLRDELLDTLVAAIGIRSVNPTYADQNYDDLVGGETEVSQLMAGVYREAGAEVDLFGKAPGRDNAVGVVAGTGGGRSLIFNGHVDVVPADDIAAWTTDDPFTAVLADDHIWGRGSVDMKGGLVAQAFAARALREAGVRLKGDLILQAVAGEENLEHEMGTSAVLARGYRGDAAIVAEPTGAARPLTVMPATPGVLVMRVHLTGKSAHASMRSRMLAERTDQPVAASAIDAGLAVHAQLRNLETEWVTTKIDPLFAPGQFTIGLDVIDGGSRGGRNVAFIPDEMTLDYAVFYPPAAELSEIQGEIERAVAGVTAKDTWLRGHPPVIEWQMHYPGGRTDGDHPFCLSVVDAQTRASVDTRLSGAPDVVPFPSATDLTWLAAAGIPTVGLGPGSLGMAHAVDERCAIDEIMCAAKTYAITAIDWCGVG